MRVISQSGEFDFPYEQIAVYRNENIVFARLVVDSKVRNVLGEYEMPKKAEKAMEMLHEAYQYSCYCDSAFDDSAKVQRPYLFMNNRVFRMPQDSEVQI